MTRIILRVALATTALTLSLTHTASASHISISSQNFRVTWNPLVFGSASGPSGSLVRCNVTLEGSFHSATIAKTIGALVGYVTRASLPHPCTGGEAWALTAAEGRTETLPWHVTFEGFEGALPTISGVRQLLHVSFQINLFGVECLYEGNDQGSSELTRGVATFERPDGSVGIPKKSGGFLCPNEGFFGAETGTVTVLGTTTRITVTLI